MSKLRFSPIILYSAEDTNGHSKRFFLARNDAEKFAEGKGEWGGPSSIGQHYALEDHEGIYWILSASTPVEVKDLNTTLRETASAKLSPAERRAVFGEEK